MPDPTPAASARRHALETMAAHARALAAQPALSETAPDDARAYRAAWTATLDRLADWLMERAA